MLEIALASSFGAFLQELLHWAEQRNRLDARELQSLLRSVQYWAIVALVIISSGIAAYFWWIEQPSIPKTRDAMLFGAALPALLKKGFAAANSKRHLGSGKTFTQLYLGT